VYEVRDGQVRETHLDPGDLGLARSELEQLRGGDAQEAARIARAVLAGEPGPRRDVVLLNAAAALEVAGAAASMAEGLELAARSIDEGRAAEVLERWIAVSREAAGG
jgi:anthranilate phosphoribosyltransferase